MRCVSGIFVPDFLTYGQKEIRVSICMELEDRLVANMEIMAKITTGYESWVHSNDFEMNIQSNQLKMSGSPRPKEVPLSKSNVNIMLIVFFIVSA